MVSFVFSKLKAKGVYQITGTGKLPQIAANCPCYNTGGKWWKAEVELSGLM